MTTEFEFQLSRGVTSIRGAIADYMESHLPRRIMDARAMWGVADYQLCIPELFNTYDPLITKKWPAMGSYVTRSSSHAELNSRLYGNSDYWPRYEVTTFLWTRTPQDPETPVWDEPEYDTALKHRDDLLYLVRSLILDDPSLGGQPLLVDKTTLAETYMDAIRPSGEGQSHWIAGGTISFSLNAAETNFVPDYPTMPDIRVEVIDVTTQRFPDGYPPLPQ